MLKKVLKPFLIVVSIALLILIRFAYINEFPVGILHDEADVSLSAKTYWKFGTDLSGIKFPQSLFVTNTWAYLSGLPSFLLSPFFGPTKLDPGTIRFPFVLIGIGISLFIALMIYEITKNKKISLISLFVSLINPWLFFYSRQATEAPFALFFSLVGIYLFFKLKKSKILFSIPFFVFSFFSYFGAKPAVPVLMILLTAIHWWKIRSSSRMTYIVMFASAILLVLVYFMASKSMNGSTFAQRRNQLTFSNLDKYSTIVDEKRRSSIDFPAKNIFYNKITVLLDISIRQLLKPFSVNYLFVSGDGILSFGEHGVLYLPDLIFIILGFALLSKSKQKSDKLVLLLVIALFVSGSIGPMISSSGDQQIFRAFLHIPAYMLLISYGLNSTPYILSVLIYTVFFINFLTFFLFRYSIEQQDNHFITERILSGYIDRSEGHSEKLVVVVNETSKAFYQYAFYSNIIDRLSRLPVYKGKEDIVSDKITFTVNCPEYNKNTLLIAESTSDCSNFGDDFEVIQSQKDAGVRFRIYNDNLCPKDSLTNYRREHLISDYNIEKMSDYNFCNRWIQNGKTN
jgi:hypothetical protein